MELPPYEDEEGGIAKGSEPGGGGRPRLSVTTCPTALELGSRLHFTCGGADTGAVIIAGFMTPVIIGFIIMDMKGFIGFIIMGLNIAGFAAIIGLDIIGIPGIIPGIPGIDPGIDPDNDPGIDPGIAPGIDPDIDGIDPGIDPDKAGALAGGCELKVSIRSIEAADF